MSRKVSKEARLTRASHQSASALGLFYRAADELEAAGNAAAAVANEARDEAEVLVAVAHTAADQAAESFTHAKKIREFFV